MRTPLILLSCLALAAVASATPTASSSATLDVGYVIDPALSYAFVDSSVNRPGREAGEYIYNSRPRSVSVPAGQNPVFEYTDDSFNHVKTVADPSRYSGSVTGLGGGTMVGSDRLVLNASTAGSFQSAASDTSDLFEQRLYGYRYFLHLTNNDTDATHSATFNFNLLSQSVAGTVDTPYDFGTSLGQYAEADNDANVIDTSKIDPVNNQFLRDTLGSMSGLSFTDDRTQTSGGITFTVPKAVRHTHGQLVPGFLELEIYTSATVYLENDRRPAAVPEPASFLPMGLGALGLLRRRRKA